MPDTDTATLFATQAEAEAEVVRLREALAHAEAAHRQDNRIITEALDAEAEQHDWCDDYQDAIQAVNRRLHIPLDAKWKSERTYLVRIDIDVDDNSVYYRFARNGIQVDAPLRLTGTYYHRVTAQSESEAARKAGVEVTNWMIWDALMNGGWPEQGLEESDDVGAVEIEIVDVDDLMAYVKRTFDESVLSGCWEIDEDMVEEVD